MTDTLKSKIKKMSYAEIIPFIYGVSLVATDPTNKDRRWDYPLKIENVEFNKYRFITTIFFEGHEMITECCKLLKIKKLHRLFGLPMSFSYKQVCQIIDTLPVLFPKYTSDKHIYKFISFDKDEVIEECKKQRLPYLIETTTKEIEELENSKSKIDKLKSDLQYYKNKLDSYKK